MNGESDGTEIPEPREPDPALLGVDEKMVAVRATIARVAQAAQATVLVTGESGTGKELVAQLIHRQSACRRGPFVAVDCPSVPAALFENELFGHERGAYTGADARQGGRVEEADRGTLFLDEVGDLPLEVQPKLLRCLSERKLTRLGSSRPIAFQARVISATNRDLSEMAERGAFRRDLFYRLNVVQIDLPPLRERRGDTPLLIAHFVDGFCRQYGLPLRSISPEALARLVRYPWPGNVRELQNVLERAVILTPGSVITPESLPQRLWEQAQPGPVRPATEAEEPEPEAELLAALRAAGWNVSRASRALGLHRATLHRRILAAGLRRRMDRDEAAS